MGLAGSAFKQPCLIGKHASLLSRRVVTEKFACNKLYVSIEGGKNMETKKNMHTHTHTHTHTHLADALHACLPLKSREIDDAKAASPELRKS